MHKYAQNMQEKICKIYANNMQTICKIYMQNMQNMLNMQDTCKNMQEICKKYARNFKKNAKKICTICIFFGKEYALYYDAMKYARYMLNMRQKNCKNYAKLEIIICKNYARNMQEICKIYVE